MGRREGRREEEREGASGRERERVRDRGIKRMRNDREMRGKKERICRAREIHSEVGTASGRRTRKSRRAREERPVGEERGSRGKAPGGQLLFESRLQKFYYCGLREMAIHRSFEQLC